jgi:hypothetical protein
MAGAVLLPILLLLLLLPCQGAGRRLTLPWPWEWDEPAHTLTWGTSSWQNCSTLDPNSTRDCLDSVRELDLMLTRDVVYIQGYDFARELREDDFAPALLEARALRQHMAARGSRKPYAILGYRGDVAGPATDSTRARYSTDPAFAGFWLVDDAGVHHDCGPLDPRHGQAGCAPMWDFRNSSARECYVADVLRENNRSAFDGVFVDTGDAVAIGGLSMTVETRRDIFNATARVWKQLSDAANAAHGERPVFLVTPSLKDHLGYDPDGDDSRPRCNASTPMDVACAPYGEEAIYEQFRDTLWAPHRQFNIPSRDFGKDSEGCAALARTVIGQGQRGPQMLTCNGCNQSTPEGRAMFKTTFAAYLIGAEKHSYLLQTTQQSHFRRRIHSFAPSVILCYNQLQCTCAVMCCAVAGGVGILELARTSTTILPGISLGQICRNRSGHQRPQRQ